MKKALKRIGIGLGVLIIGFILIIFVFTQTSPQFGGKDSAQDIIDYNKSGHYKDGKFQNLIPTNADDMTFAKMLSVSKDFIFGVPRTKPEFDLPQEKVDSIYLEKSIHIDKLIWFGHSAFLLQLDGENILLDPMLGESPSPHPFVGPKRFNRELPIEIQQLPKIDAIIISHDHYDHLDYESIQLLKEKTAKFFVPLGVGKHLKSWGINADDIKELNWWDETEFKDIHLAFTPSRHFSGRGFSDGSSSMWGSWVIKGKTKNIYFSGDSGYGPHFKEIGDKYGPFDFAMMECGQYNENWLNIHMVPEETAKASIDLKTKVMMPIHWGAFALSLHTWDDPIIRVTEEAKALNLPITVPIIGEIITL
ncbi:MBL fold metallo-hydrolase, partial [Crocinitomicaceae bacterium]|nr:MBL fold metallo-hydrolase [Crocinitomicaceae bacterium]